MSKHEKQVRRERKKTDRARRRAYGRWTGAALAAMVALAVATPAEASPIRFDNPLGPEHFVWYGGPPTDAIGLEIISDAASQTGAFVGLAQFGQTNADPSTPNNTVKGGLGGGEFQVTGPYGDMVVGVDFGDPIPSGYAWRSVAYIYYPGDPWYLPENEETYLGVRFPLVEGGDWHHGWIGIVRTGVELDAFAWGYETEPGVGIPAGAPEPGSLALLALGAGAALGRRRQRGN